MLVNKTYFIDSCDDVELNIKRESKLEYRITYDDSKQMKAIVFIIGGYGANENINFLESYRKFIAKKFDVVAVNVFYHCFCQRISDMKEYSALKIFEEEDIEILKHVLQDFCIQNYDVDSSNAHIYGNFLVKNIEQLKNEGKLFQSYRVSLSAGYIPPNNEYNNFAIMPAIDHINALKDIMKNYPQFKTLPKIYGGGVIRWLSSINVC
ncbi:DUF2920 family protein [Campylobacter peloridis]|uniref:DUF2920 family protein n=1 Tax=Campylobacter peloridis TaxID=488546 RepID=UPI0035C73F74